MGSGASRGRKAEQRESRASSGVDEEELKKMCRNRRQSAVGDMDAEDVDPETCLDEGQSVLYSGTVWKLNFGGDPLKAEDWLKRKMWLTTGGSLFYFSSRFEAPLSRSVWDFNIVKPGTRILGRWVLELFAKADHKNKMPTVIATETSEECHQWLHHLQEMTKGGDEQSGLLQPFEYYGDEHKQMKGTHFPQAPRLGLPTADKHAEAGCFSHALKAHLPDVDAGKEVADNMVRKTSLISKNGDGWSIFTQTGASLPPDPELAINSQDLYSSKDSTVLVLDWDDTLFPTSFLTGDCGLNWRYPIREQAAAGPERDELEATILRYSEKVESFLRQACAIAKVVIVTLARKPWVDISSHNFIPCLQKVIDELGVTVVYVREVMSEEMQREDVAGMFKTKTQESDFWMRGKAFAMKQQFEVAYAGAQSWKNLISIGDSDYERLALRKVAQEYLEGFMPEAEPVSAHTINAEDGLMSHVVCKDGLFRRLRVKTVKLLEDPSLDMMVAEISLMCSWLPHLVELNSGLDIQISDPDDDVSLNKANKQITGRDHGLTWLGLAGLDTDEASSQVEEKAVEN